MFPPKSFVFPEYHRSMSRPFRLTVFSRQRSEATILPSRITYGVPSATARSSASSRPGASADTTSVTSAKYRYDVACDRPNPPPAQAAGALPGTDLLAAPGQQPRDEQDQVPGHVKSDTIGDQRGVSRQA